MRVYHWRSEPIVSDSSSTVRRLAAVEPNPIASNMTADVFSTLSTSSQPQMLVAGVLYISPPPSDEEETIAYAMMDALRMFTRAHGGAAVEGRDCYLTADTVLRPDAAYLVPERAHLAGFHVRGAPDVAIEIHSQGTAEFDRSAKLPAYLAAGSREVWLVDPGIETVTVIRADVAFDEGLSVRFGEPIPSAVLDVGRANLAPRRDQ